MGSSQDSLLTSLVLLSSGSVLIAFSALTNMSIPAFIGLGLTFLGLVPIYLKNGSRTFQLEIESRGRGLQAILRKTNQSIYLPIPNGERLNVESFAVAEETTSESTRWAANRSKERFHLRRVDAPGAKTLSELERAFGTDLSEVKTSFLASRLSRALTNDLRLATSVDLVGKKDRIQVEIRGSQLTDACAKVMEQSPPVDSLGCELCSAIAMALVKTTGRPIVIEETNVSLADRLIRTKFRTFSLPLKPA